MVTHDFFGSISLVLFFLFFGCSVYLNSVRLVRLTAWLVGWYVGVFQCVCIHVFCMVCGGLNECKISSFCVRIQFAYMLGAYFFVLQMVIGVASHNFIIFSPLLLCLHEAWLRRLRTCCVLKCIMNEYLRFMPEPKWGANHKFSVNYSKIYYFSLLRCFHGSMLILCAHRRTHT